MYHFTTSFLFFFAENTLTSVLVDEISNECEWIRSKYVLDLSLPICMCCNLLNDNSFTTTQEDLSVRYYLLILDSRIN